MGIYDVVLGVDRAARDTGRRITMRVRERNPLAAAIAAEELVDSVLQDPVEYTHTMQATPATQTAMVQEVPLALVA